MGPLLGGDYSRPARLESIVDMIRARPQNLRDLCRGLKRKPDLVLPVVQLALEQGLIRRTNGGYEHIA